MKTRFVFTVDVEGIPLENGNFDYSSVITGLPLLLNLFKEFHVCATFFTTSDVAENNTKVVKKVIQNGHEIACHGFEHQLLDLNSRAAQLDNIKKATEIIHRNLGVTPLGFRAPVNKANEHTLDVLTELNYEYDSSVAPSSKLLSKYYYPKAPQTPYRPSTYDMSRRGQSPILEIPLSVLPWIRLPIGLSYMMLFGLSFYRFFLSKLDQEIVTVFLHPYDLFTLPNQTNFRVIEQKRFFRLLHTKGKGQGYAILRELLVFFEEKFNPTYICAKSVLPHVSTGESHFAA